MKFAAIILVIALFGAAVAMPYHDFRPLSMDVAPGTGSYNHAADMVPYAGGQSVRSTGYLILHKWVWTQYITWSYAGHPDTQGLTWGLQCKGVGCNVKTGFVGFRSSTGIGFLRKRGVEPVGSTEHSHDYGKVFCPTGKFMTSMTCKDRACTSMELVCAPLKHGFRAVYDTRWGGVWSHDYQRVYCREGEYIDGIECVGSCTKHFNIFCTKVEGYGTA